MINRMCVLGPLAAVVSLMVCAGCGPNRPETATVSGRVTYQGKPVVEGTIVFMPEQGRQAMGTIAADGSYTLTTFDPGDGALLGWHRVMIESRRITDTMSGNGSAGEGEGGLGPPVVEWLVPEKYSRPETSPLKAEVKKGENTFDFDLPI